MDHTLPSHARIAVVGAGFSGLCMAIRLKQKGIEDFVVLERADEVGGTWRDNTYPGCQCDIPSALYSFSFAPNPDWSETYSKQPEIRDYLRRCADEFGVRPHLRFGHTVTSAAWDEDARRWDVETSHGRFRARHELRDPVQRDAVQEAVDETVRIFARLERGQRRRVAEQVGDRHAAP